MKTMIIPAIIAATQEELDSRIKKVVGLVPRMQLDIMDGKFVPNQSLNFDFRVPKTGIYEAHLMVNDPMAWIDSHGEKVDVILIHIESCPKPEEIINQLAGKKKIGFAVNPETSLDTIISFLDKIDQVLIMTVNPGFYGSPFVPEALTKVKTIRKIHPEIDLEVDGSINEDTIISAHRMGANLFVSGSYIMKAENVQRNIDKLRGLLGD